MVAGLLFLALAYLAVGQAAVNRSGAQTAADAAALAAAQNARQQLAGRWVLDLRDPTEWQDIFDGTVGIDSPDAPCLRAGQLAALNDAEVRQCQPGNTLSYRVDVRTNKPVGDSVVPGTEKVKSTASARAVIKSLCTYDPPAAGADDTALPKLTCKDDRVWDLDPDHLTDLPKPDDLFDVHLADD